MTVTSPYFAKHAMLDDWQVSEYASNNSRQAPISRSCADFSDKTIDIFKIICV